jgi:hypothetical protein
MRTELKELDGKRGLFYGTFQRRGYHWSWRAEEVETILLENILDEEGNLVADHIWVNDVTVFRGLDLAEYIQVSFYARVKEYMRGYLGRRKSQYDKRMSLDYTLVDISDVSVVGMDKSLAC